MTSRRRIWIYLLCFLLIACSVGAAGSFVYADYQPGDGSDTVTVRKNFDLENDDSGKFAPYLLNTAEMNYLTTEDNPPTAELLRQYGFSGLFAHETGNGKYSWNANVALYSASSSGASVSLGEGYKKFTTIARPIQSAGVNIAVGQEDYGKLRYVITDLDRPDNVLTIELQDDPGNISWIYASYNGSDPQRLGMAGFCFRGGHYFSTPTDGFKFPLILCFDTEAMRISTGRRMDVSVNLREFYKNIEGFEHFSVDLVFPEVRTGATANLLIYEVNSQVYVGKEFPHTVAPQILLGDYPRGIWNEEYVLPAARAVHMLEGDLTDSLEITVTDPTGGKIIPTDGAFVPTQEGEYTITYYVKDSHDLDATETVTVEILKVLPRTEITLSGELPDTIGRLGTLRLPAASADSAVSVQVQKEGKLLASFADASAVNRIQLTETGEYRIIYSCRGEMGNIDTLAKRVTCDDRPVILDPGIPDQLEFGTGRPYYVPAAQAVSGSETKDAVLEVISPSGSKVSLGESNAFLASEVGTYLFRYSAEFGSQTAFEEFPVNVVYTSEGLFEEVNDVDEFVPNAEVRYLAEEGVTGLGVIGKVNNMTFRFKNVVDLSKLDKDTDVIRLQPLSGDGYAALNEFQVILTDAHDPSRVVRIKFAANTQWAYASVNFDGRYLGRSNENNSSYGMIRVNEYGTVMGSTFTPNEYAGKFMFAFQMDYAEKQFLITNWNLRSGQIVNEGQDVIIDADDISHVGDGNEWEGFTTGEVYISVTLPQMYGDGGIIVSEIAGQKLGGLVVEDETGPEVAIELDSRYLGELPDGVVNVRYPIPTAYANDLLAGTRDVSVSLYRLGGAEPEDISGEISDYGFTTSTPGTYRLVYSATDFSGNVGTLTKEFEIRTSIPGMNADYASMPDTAVAGSVYTLPEINVTGGSGLIEEDVRIRVFIGDQEVTVGGSRRIRLTGTDDIRMEVYAKDYLGRELRKTFTIEVQAPEKPVIVVEGVPDTVQKGGTLVLPDFDAFNYKYRPEEPGYLAEKEIWVGDVQLGADRTYQVTESGDLTVRYIARSGGQYTEEIFTVRVLEGQYIAADKAMTVDLQQSYTEVSVPGGTELTFANPAVAHDFRINFGFAPDSARPDSLEIEFEDYFDKISSVFVKLTPKDDTTCNLEVNGNTGKLISAPGSFSSANAAFTFILNNVLPSIQDEAGARLANFENTQDGDDFSGFASGAVRVRIRIGSASGTVKLRFYAYANQSFASFSGQYVDAMPQIVYHGSMIDHTVEKGDNITAVAANAYDALNGPAEVRIRAVDPNGNVVLNDVLADQAFTLPADAYGEWSITYTAWDGKMNATRTFFVRVADREAPAITVDGTLPETVKAGETITLPKATATDNFSPAELTVFVQAPSARYTVVTPDADGELKAVLSEKGVYRIVYYAVDEDYNVCEKVFEVTVE